MTESPRKRRAPLIVLALVAVAATAAACIVIWISSEWRFTVNAYWEDNANGELGQEDYEAMDRLSFAAYQLTEIARPLFVGAVAAVLMLLAVLAWRWERKPTDSGQATAAS